MDHGPPPGGLSFCPVNSREFLGLALRVDRDTLRLAMSSDTPHGPTPNASPVAFPRSITKATPTPFAVHRNLVLSDGTLLPVVRIDIVRADWSAVDDEGFCGDWESHLQGRGLTPEQLDEALDCVSEFVETLAVKLWAGDKVPSHALASPPWSASCNSNLDPRLT